MYMYSLFNLSDSEEDKIVVIRHFDMQTLCTKTSLLFTQSKRLTPVSLRNFFDYVNSKEVFVQSGYMSICQISLKMIKTFQKSVHYYFFLHHLCLCDPIKSIKTRQCCECLTGFREVLNWVPVMPRETPASRKTVRLIAVVFPVRRPGTIST